MAYLTNNTENGLLDHVLGNTAYTRPTNLYLALSIGSPGESGVPTEPNDPAYSRQLINNWNAAVSRATANGATLTFAQATEDQGDISHFAIMGSSAGTSSPVAYGEFLQTKTVSSGDVVSVLPGDIDVSFDTGGISDYLANKLLDHVLKGDSYTQPANLYVALCSESITDSDTGSTITEPSGGYSRQLISTWDAASLGMAGNASSANFAATADWGTISDVGLCDALTAGNLLICGELTESKSVSNGDTLQFAVGALNVGLE